MDSLTQDGCCWEMVEVLEAVSVKVDLKVELETDPEAVRAEFMNAAWLSRSMILVITES